jgi:hypothetical protein
MIDKIQALIVQAQAYAKLIVSVVGGLLVIGAQLIPTEYTAIVTAIVVVLTAFSVYQFPNVESE